MRESLPSGEKKEKPPPGNPKTKRLTLSQRSSQKSERRTTGQSELTYLRIFYEKVKAKIDGFGER